MINDHLLNGENGLCVVWLSSEFLTIVVSSEVSVMPNLVEGDVDGGTLVAGHYIGGLDSESGARDDVGQPINDTVRLPRIAYVRPNRPFGVNSASWSE